MLIRTQIQLTDEQLQGLKALAARDSRSLADLVRESVDQLLRKRRFAIPAREEQVARATAFVGSFHSGVGDLGRRHDHHLSVALADWPSSSTPRR